jgi:putative peptidoglycan lipid II flippase
MLLRAGALSLALLLASRLLGLLRETALAAAFGATGFGDVAVLMLTLPDWLAGLLVSGAFAYVLLPHWARQNALGLSPAKSQRGAALWLVPSGVVVALVIWLFQDWVVARLASGLSPTLRASAARGIEWSALALPPALLAALWTTRLQHESDFLGMYSANLMVNGVLVAVLWLIASGLVTQRPGAPVDVIAVLGSGLVAAMILRLSWLHWRLRRPAAHHVTPADLLAHTSAPMPRTSLWVWATLASGLPLVLPFAARSVASQGGEGALATFNYAWKLVELPLVLAIQLVATLSFPAIAKAFADDAIVSVKDSKRTDVTMAVHMAVAVRSAFVLAWTLACAAAACLLASAPAIGQLFFGWGRMSPEALTRVASWGAVGAWGLPPQALIAVSMTVLATQGRMRAAVGAYLVVISAGILVGHQLPGDGATLMRWMNLAFVLVAVMNLAALGPQAVRWLPWRCMAGTGAALFAVVLVLHSGLLPLAGLGAAGGLALGASAAAVVMVSAWLAGPDLKHALKR